MVEQIASSDIDRGALERAQAFASRNIITANFKRIACGDGRYADEVSNGGLRMFGEDMGALAAFWRVGKEQGYFHGTQDIGDCVTRYVKAKAEVLKNMEVTDSDAYKLYLHTDSHGKEHGGYGCGHMKHMTLGAHQGETEYGISAEEAQALFAYVTDEKHEIPHAVTELQGDHGEAGVIFVRSADPDTNKMPAYSLRSLDPTTNEMYFVVDIDGVSRYLNRLTTSLRMENVTAERLYQAYERQQLTTATILAPHAPIFEAKIHGKDAVTVSPAGTIPATIA